MQYPTSASSTVKDQEDYSSISSQSFESASYQLQHPFGCPGWSNTSFPGVCQKTVGRHGHWQLEYRMVSESMGSIRLYNHLFARSENTQKSYILLF